MTESFLHYLWKYKLFSKDKLFTTDHEPIEIINPGLHNYNAGPDFLESKIKIGDTLWAGNVEMHLKSSAWNEHGHDKDKAYNNVILHAVYEHDKEVWTGNTGSMPTLILKDCFDIRLWKNYRNLIESVQWISCSYHLKEVPNLTVNNWLDNILVERLRDKTRIINELLEENKNNWEESFYQRLAYSFGLKINAETFQALAKSLPLAVIQKHRDQLLQVEAMLFGQAGFLGPGMKDSYSKSLWKEYQFLRSKFRPEPLAYASWKFLRLRPPSFPTIRIAQFAMLLHKHQNLFSEILVAESFTDLRSLFETGVSGFWQSHYHFRKDSQPTDKVIGDDFFHSIVMNTVVPFLFAYGRWKKEDRFTERAVVFLEQIPAENNKIIRQWNLHGVKPLHAAHSQALLQLRTFYCEEKNCVNCAIGNHIISKFT